MCNNGAGVFCEVIAPATITSSSVLIDSVRSNSCEMREADSWGCGQFGHPEEEERPPLEAGTKQRLSNTEKTLRKIKLE
jgi:hypothetical protein